MKSTVALLSALLLLSGCPDQKPAADGKTTPSAEPASPSPATASDKSGAEEKKGDKEGDKGGW